MIAVLIRSGDQLGFSAFSSAQAPATCGVAIDVPLSVPYLSPGNDERMLTPGAAISGFIVRSFGVGPRDEKLAMLSPESTAPTVIAELAAPGLETLWYLPELPAAMQKITPARVPLLMAREAGSSGPPAPPQLRLTTSASS